jgi:hypothetical protein
MDNEKGRAANVAQVFPYRLDQDYAFQVRWLEEKFPAWCADVLALMLERIEAQAVLVRWRLQPAGLHPVRCPSGGVLLLRYDAQGRVMVTGGDCDPEVLDLARAVRMVAA